MNYKALGYNSYAEYLESKHRKLMKAKVYATRRNKGCWICKTTADLNIHHRTYRRLGNEDLGDLVILCQPCHKKVHEFHKEHSYLTLTNATKIYQLKVSNPAVFERWYEKKKHKRLRKAEKRKWRFDFTDIQKKEIEFNRAKMQRLSLI